MTPKQKERIKNKIKKIKAALAADKRHWGGYHHDGQGIRYLPPGLYIQLEDFTGGLRYMNWFKKNFPDDAGFPDFLFEWTIILFKRGRIKEAEKKAFQCFCRNTYLFDKFFGREIKPIDKWEGSNLEVAGFAIQFFDYSHEQENLVDFAEWLEEFISTKKFKELSNEFLAIQKLLKDESEYKVRKKLSDRASQLQNEF